MTEAWLTVDNAKALGLAVGAVICTLWGNSAWRRRASKDKVVFAENDNERGAIVRLEAEILRREAERIELIERHSAERMELIARNDRLQDERNAAVMENGALRQNVLTLSISAERLEREVGLLRGQISNLMKFHELGIKPVNGKADDHG